MPETVLIVDDKVDMLKFLERIITRELNTGVLCAQSAMEALKIIKANRADVVLTDIRMPEMDGITLLKHIKEWDDSITVIMMTAYGTIDTAVESLKLGAYDFITKPFDENRLLHILKKSLEHHSLIEKNLDLQRKIQEKELQEYLIGGSPQLRKVMETIKLVAKTDVTVLITGETGTGKDLAAKTIHSLSQRSNKPFIAINCPTLPESILESELFGYKKGAFTNATQDKKGLFEVAQHGTIFLDEIGDIPPAIQTKLLRVLQEKEIKPLGDTSTLKVDVRVIASTNQNLEDKIRAGQFRDDLYYRLNVVSIRMPALRDIKEDIPLIANHFLSLYCKELGRPEKEFSTETVKILISKDWNGNVRELQNTIKRAVIFSSRRTIEPQDLDMAIPSMPCPEEVMEDIARLSYSAARKKVLERFSVQYLTYLLKETQGNVTLSAKKAGIERQSFQYLMKKYGLTSTDFRSDAENI